LAKRCATTVNEAGLCNCSGDTLTATRIGDGHLRLRRTRAQHPFADRSDQPGVLGQRHELHRRDIAMLWMVPAQQRLETLQLADAASTTGW